MQNRKTIIFLTIVITALCIYSLSFTWIARKVQREATESATNKEGQVDLNKKQKYLESVYNKPVFDFLGLEYTYKEVKEQELGLGLDLQGGMHVVLEISPVDIIRALAGPSAKTDVAFQKALDNALAESKTSQQSFVDLFFNAYKKLSSRPLAAVFSNSMTRQKGIEPNSPESAVKQMVASEVNSAIDRAENVIRTRIDKFGVASPNIQRLPNGRIQLELPGAENHERVRNLLKGVAQLEFLPVYHFQEYRPYIERINEYQLGVEKSKKSAGKSDAKIFGNDTAKTAAKADSANMATAQNDSSKALAKADTGKNAKAQAKDSAKAQENMSSFFTLQKGLMTYAVEDTAHINAILKDPKVKAMLPPNMEFLWSKPQASEAPESKGVFVTLYPVRREKGPNMLTGEYVIGARAEVSQRKPGQMEVTMAMNDEGAKRWKNMTREAAEQGHRSVAIALDKVVYSAPTVNEEIPNGYSSITGNFSKEDADDLALVLETGKLPAPVNIVEEVVIGPSLGREAISQGLNSVLAGLLVVVLFMIFYYGKGGFVADVALMFNILFILGFMASIDAVLTLPGIAGMVLTVGMAVDANVLIFERIREELAAGKPLAAAINLGYDKAFSSIFDSNITTIITAALLWWLGSGPVQGFGVTLFWGLLTSFFTSVFISKVIILWITRNKDEKSLSFSTSMTGNLFKNFNADFIGKRKVAYVISSVVILTGIISIIAQGGLNLGVDFKGGRSYVVRFEQPVAASDVRNVLTKEFQDAGTEVKAYGSNYMMKVTTTYLTNDESTEADKKVSEALNQGLSGLQGNKAEILSTTKVGPTVARDIIANSLKAIIFSLIGIFVYVLVRFRRWQFSLGGVLALLHDALVVISLFSIMRWFGYALEIDQVFIAAILTIVGFSINDTVIIFDRIREFMAENNKMPLPSVLNNAINHTMSRTIITTLTVFIVVVILLIFGGETLRGFSLAMLIGIISGTYSTIYIAVPIVLDVGRKQEAVAPATAATPVKKEKV